MADFDLVLRDGLVADEVTDVGVNDGRITAIRPNLSGSSEAEICLKEKSLFPGFIDAHVHFNEPGRADWEGFETGSRALAAGGGTFFCDMPLNSSPPVVDAASFVKKRELGEAKSCLDFSLWGGMIPGNSDAFPALADLGAVGLKAFMANSGLDEFPWVSPEELREGMKAARASDLLVAVHAESQVYLDAMPKSEGRTIREFLDSRPIAAEVEAIRIACELAGEMGCRLHIVHVSSTEGIAEIQKAKRQGVDVSAETCPHYLCFCEEDLNEFGAAAKCTPPLRHSNDVCALIGRLVAGEIDTIGSDHSPSLPEMKSGDFADAWGGISSCQHAFPAFLGSYPDYPDLITKNPAERLGIADRKGSIEVGKDADFAIVDFSETDPVRRDSLLYRHPVSPYVGKTIGCRIEMTICRGKIVHGESFKSNQICSQFLAKQEPT